MTTSEAPARFLLPQFLSLQECKELEFIHKSCGVVGYRPFVLSTPMAHLVATNCAHLIIPMLSVRERVREAVEEYFGREYELFVEFTGLISWTKGSSIGWHSDNNRPYLHQRHYSAVCYLNTYERDFKGGLFHFQEGELLTVIPSVGTVLIYTADEKNMHRVDEVTEGERCTLALWFTSDQVHDEDQKLIQQILTVVPGLQAQLSDEDPNKVSKSPPKQRCYHPIAAPSVMYEVHNLKKGSDQPDQCTLLQPAHPYFNIPGDLRVIRLALMGFSCCFKCTVVDKQDDRPVVLTYNHKEVPHLFANSLEALQVALFHQLKSFILWRPPVVPSGQYPEMPLSNSIAPDANSLISSTKPTTFSIQRTTASEWRGCSIPVLQQVVSVGDPGQSEIFLVPSHKVEYEELDDFLHSIHQFECYTSSLLIKLFQLWPKWRTSGSLLLHG